ncbi:MAG: fibronectin type III domain-containing protein, partial [Lentimicrobiaceae bacterium]|nr:fibronectin type III domain-containing protein [Lentimicrobiaceae bacterium]
MSYDTAPFPPTDVSARVESSTSIQITWSSVSNAKSYEVHCQNASLPLSKIATVSGTSYTHKDLKQDTAYTYSIRASNNAGTSDLSTPATATTTIRIPNSPTSVTLNLTTL